MGVLAICAGGAWISGELVRQHAGEVWRHSSSSVGLLDRACGAAQRFGFDCGGVERSGWGEISVPLIVPTPDLTLRRHTVVVPVAFLGLAYFVFLGVWFAFIGSPRPVGRRWHRLPLAVAVVGALTSLLLLAAMAVGYAPWCLSCLAVHLLNLALVCAVWRMGAVAKRAASRPESVAGNRPRRLAAMTLTRREVVCTVAFASIIVAGLWMYRRDQLAFRRQYGNLLPYRTLLASLQEDPEFLLREFYAQPRLQIPTPADGRLELVVFTDYQCGPCYCSTLRLRRQLHDAFEDVPSISVRHYPLCTACNPRVESNIHPAACRAAYAAEAARLQGGDEAFWRMHELLFANRSRLSDDIYGELAEQIGLDCDRLLREMAGDEVRRAVAADIELAGEWGVVGTPAIFLNGRRVPQICLTETFWRAIAETRGIPPTDRVAARPDGRNITGLEVFP